MKTDFTAIISSNRNHPEAGATAKVDAKKQLELRQLNINLRGNVEISQCKAYNKCDDTRRLHSQCQDILQSERKEMFEVPDAKRVKRSELFGSNSPSGDEQDNVASDGKSSGRKPSKPSGSQTTEEQTTAIHQRSDDQMDIESGQPPIDYGFEYEFVNKTLQTPTTRTPATKTSEDAKPTNQLQQSTTDANDQSQSFEFNLFAPKSKPKSKATIQPTAVNPSITRSPSPARQKITIRANSPSPNPDVLGLSAISASSKYTILRPRALSYYLTASESESIRERRQQEYDIAAVPATQLTRLASSPWPGTCLPWRVTHMTSGKLQRNAQTVNITDGKNVNVRGRPSKKRRIQMRKRVAARRALMEQGQVAAEAEREKRTRRNREKKVKKKQREKAKKAETRSGADADRIVEKENEATETATTD